MGSKPRIALFIGILCISIFPVLVKMALVPGLISAFYRMAIAALFIVPYALLTKKLKVYDRKTMTLIVLCGMCFGLDIGVWNIAIQGSTATQATLLGNLAPVWVGIGSYFFLQIKPSVNFWIGTVLALIGMVTLVGVEVFVNLSFDIPFLFSILSGLLYATYILMSKKVLEQVEVVPFMSYSILVSTIFLALLNFVMGSAFTGFSTEGWMTLVVQGIVCQLLAWLLISYATQNMRATRVSLSLLSQALVAALLAWYFLDEGISLQMIAGGCIILLGIALTFVNKPLIGRSK
ncbi:DMT family transporter [Myroides sp. DF42-4-2]|uniref:DMT family transporter n=1 Tax=unclassified Myroides TaxID=2642485 RepID=UPI0025753597|nr:DMT family transporter [Myroides sp. DF42-4-2]MDM1406299.1 DMT family transporter [Myroides sp. DF42-4-2]